MNVSLDIKGASQLVSRASIDARGNPSNCRETRSRTSCCALTRRVRLPVSPGSRILCDSAKAPSSSAQSQSNPHIEPDTSQSFLSRLEKYADDQKRYAEATSLPPAPCTGASENIAKPSRLGFPVDEPPDSQDVYQTASAPSSEDAPPSVEGRSRKLSLLIDELASFLTPREHGDIRDITLVCLSFAVLVYISQRLVCAYCVVSGTFNNL